MLTEADLQKQIVQWCHLQLHSYIVFWATSNERKAKPQHMAALKKMGVLSGVTDLILLGMDGPVFIELKRPTTYKVGKSGKQIINSRGGVQSDAQKDFQTNVELIGFKYHMIDNLDDFITVCKTHGLTNTNPEG